MWTRCWQQCSRTVWTGARGYRDVKMPSCNVTHEWMGSISRVMFGKQYHFTRATVVSAGISCRRVSVCPSVTSRCSTETAKRGISGSRKLRHTISRTRFLTPKISAKLRRGRPQRRRQIQVWWVKCRCGSWKLATFDAKRCQLSLVASLSHWASTLFVCSTFAVMQRVARVCQRQLILVAQRRSET